MVARQSRPEGRRQTVVAQRPKKMARGTRCGGSAPIATHLATSPDAHPPSWLLPYHEREGPMPVPWDDRNDTPTR